MQEPAGRLNLPAIEQALQSIQVAMNDVIRRLDAERDSFTDEIRDNMLAGYRQVDSMLADGVRPFELGTSERLLELNNTVLYGSDTDRWARYESSIAANTKRFYEKQEGGIGDLVQNYQMHNYESVWNRCALVYIHMLSQPQLFIEGNHRTACLLLSLILVWEGNPPFVLTAGNAADFFQPSTLIGRSKRHSLRMMLRHNRLKKNLAGLLRRTADSSFLVLVGEAAG